MLSHDKDMIGDFTDDIDTLLVFVRRADSSLAIPFDVLSILLGGTVIRCAHSVPL